MKMSKWLLVICLFATVPELVLADRYVVYSNCNDAYTYARRGYNSDDLDDIHAYAKRAMNAAEDAMNAAAECQCRNAYEYASEIYKFARMAYRSNEVYEAQGYLRRAKRAADDGMLASNECGN
jgi:hypothetical protein